MEKGRMRTERGNGGGLNEHRDQAGNQYVD